MTDETCCAVLISDIRFNAMFRTMMAGDAGSYPQTTKRIWRRSAKYYCRIDVSGFIGVLIVLIFIFAASMPQTHGRGVYVQLPNAKSATVLQGLDRDDALIVSVTSRNRVFFGGEQVSIDFLANKIKDQMMGAARPVYIKADVRCSYRIVANVLKEIRTAGVSQIAFVTERRPIRQHP